MRHIAIVGVDTESETVECEIAESGERVRLPLDARLRAAARGEFLADGEEAPADASAESGSSTAVEPAADAPAPHPDHVRLRPKEMQDRVRMGASVDELVELTGFSRNRVEAYAYPILQERAARAEKARKAHPLLGDGPALETVEDKTLASLEERGIDEESLGWDAWRLKNGNWVLEASWPAGLSDNATATWECVPDSHGGVARPLDDEARAIGDPSLRRGLAAVDGEASAYPQGHPGQQGFPGYQGHPGHQPHVSNLYAMPRHGGNGGYGLPHDPTTQPEPYVIGRPVSINQPRPEQPAAPEAPAAAGPAEQAASRSSSSEEGDHTRPATSGVDVAGHSVATDDTAKLTRTAPIEMGPGTGTAGAAGTKADNEPQQAASSEPETPDAADGEDEGNDFFLHPPAEGPQKSKGRHPTMPSWEDVLLGVRSPKE